MIRPVTCVCMLLAAGSGLYLYQTKHRSQLLDQQITGILNNADANRERMRVLRAEYQLLQDPGRLGDLAAQHLTLAKTDSKQFVTWATLERMIPVVIAPPPPVADPTPVAEPETPVAGLVGPPAPPAAGPAAPQTAIARADAPTPRPVSPPAVPPPAQIAARVAAAAMAPAAPPHSPAPSVAPQAALMASAAPVSRSALGMARAEPGWASNAAPRGIVAASQTAMATQRRYPYQAPQFGGTDAMARIARAAVADPATAPVASALGMARALSSSSYISPAGGAGWLPNGGGG